MSIKTCFIVGAGQCELLTFCKGAQDLVIAADGGLLHLLHAGIDYDYVIGDLDSMPQDIQLGAKLIKLEPEKDETDTLYATKFALEQGYTNFEYYGCMGARMSHSIANIQLLHYLAQHGATGKILHESTSTTVINNNSIMLKNTQKYLSVFSLTNSTRVTIKGVKYPLNDFLLTNTNPLGISNEICENYAHIEAKEGSLLIITGEC